MCPISEVVDNNPGVIVCGVGLHPNNIVTNTVYATTDCNAALLQRMTTLCHPLHAWEDARRVCVLTEERKMDTLRLKSI